jgi:cytochrome P450
MAIRKRTAARATDSSYSLPNDEGPPTTTFDLNDLRSSSLIEKFVQRLLDDPQWLFGLLRRYCPIPIIPFVNLAVVTRFDDVQEVLGHDWAFPVPFGNKVKELNGGPNFLLGMQPDADYWRYQKQVMRVFTLEDITKFVGPLATQFSEDIVARSGGKLDAIQDLITRVPTLICESYYGVPIAEQDRVDFANWTIAMSTYMFGDPSDKPAYRRVGVAAGDRVRRLITRAIADAKTTGAKPNSVLARMIDMQSASNGDLTDEAIRTILIGMITGFVPTNTMAAGHMLEMLLRRPDFLEQTRAAAIAGDDDLLKRCLFEAMRFMPLNPGPFRICAHDYTVAEGSSRAKRIRAGTKMLASTQSAMFDERQVKEPYKFDPARPATDYMLFGYGLHWCVGIFIAETQITQTFKALLVKNGLRRAQGKAGQLQLLGPFPEHLTVEFEP